MMADNNCRSGLEWKSKKDAVSRESPEEAERRLKAALAAKRDPNAASATPAASPTTNFLTVPENQMVVPSSEPNSPTSEALDLPADPVPEVSGLKIRRIFS